MNIMTSFPERSAEFINIKICLLSINLFHNKLTKKLATNVQQKNYIKRVPVCFLNSRNLLFVRNENIKSAGDQGRTRCMFYNEMKTQMKQER